MLLARPLSRTVVYLNVNYGIFAWAPAAGSLVWSPSACVGEWERINKCSCKVALSFFLVAHQTGR